MTDTYPTERRSDAVPRRSRRLTPARAAVAAALVGLAGAAADARATPMTEVVAGSEPSLQAILDGTGHTLARVSDADDQVWSMPEGRVLRARPYARYAGARSGFSVGAVGGPEGSMPEAGPDWIGALDPLFEAPATQGVVPGDTPWHDVVGLAAGEAIAFAIDVGSRTHTSVPSANLLGDDHMVTWVDLSDPYHFFVGFEDVIGLGDRDYNDLVVELWFEPTPDPASIAEPSTLAVLVADMVCLRLLLRRRIAAIERAAAPRPWQDAVA